MLNAPLTALQQLHPIRTLERPPRLAVGHGTVTVTVTDTEDGEPGTVAGGLMVAEGLLPWADSTPAEFTAVTPNV